MNIFADGNLRDKLMKKALNVTFNTTSNSVIGEDLSLPIYKFSRHMTAHTRRQMTAQRLCFSPQPYILVVMEMKKIKPLKKGSLTGKVLRLLGTNRGFGEPPSDQEEIGNIYVSYNCRKGIETALLEAERKKAKALMEMRKRHFIY